MCHSSGVSRHFTGNSLDDVQNSSSAFADGQRIPTKYTADGDDISPPIDWSDAPAGAKSFLLAVEDPDAPSGTFHHWGLYNLHTRGVPEGFASADRQDDIESAINDFGEPGYRGPAPPPGHGTHHYHFKSGSPRRRDDRPTSTGQDRRRLARGAKPCHRRSRARRHVLALNGGDQFSCGTV